MYDVTYDEILARMLEKVSDNFDKREGSVIFDSLSPTAVELQNLYTELNTLIAESYGDSASREYLIKRCAERGITPYDAAKAVLRGEFTPASIDVTGKRFNIDALNFEVKEKAEDADGVYYRVECETAGTVGNQYTGTMTPIDYIPGLETAKLTAVLVPGEDEEDTEDLRKRYFDSFTEKAFGGNVADYLAKTNAISGVGSTKVTRAWNSGISPADMIPTANVTTWYNTTIASASLNADVKNWLTSVYTAAAAKHLTTGGTVLLTILNSDYRAASSVLVQNVQNAVDPSESAGEGDGLAPIGHVVTVKSAVEKTVDVSVALTPAAGYSWEQLKTPVETAINNYFAELRKEWADKDKLSLSVWQVLIRVSAIDGIESVSKIKLNGSESDLTLAGDEIPVLGDVTNE